MDNLSQRFDIEEGPVLQALLAISEWHTLGNETLAQVLEKIQPGFELAFNGPDGEKQVVKLNADQCYGFRMGLSLALTHFGQLPVQLDFNGAEAVQAAAEVPEVRWEDLPQEEKDRLAAELKNHMPIDFTFETDAMGHDQLIDLVAWACVVGFLVLMLELVRSRTRKARIEYQDWLHNRSDNVKLGDMELDGQE